VADGAWERVYCDVDDLCRELLPAWERQLLEAGARHRQRHAALTVSEVMTIVIAFELSGYRTFKHCYIDCVGRYHRDAFPMLVRYSRFVEFMPSVLMLCQCCIDTLLPVHGPFPCARVLCSSLMTASLEQLHHLSPCPKNWDQL
jgi:hypothetical protein